MLLQLRLTLCKLLLLDADGAIFAIQLKLQLASGLRELVNLSIKLLAAGALGFLQLLQFFIKNAVGLLEFVQGLHVFDLVCLHLLHLLLESQDLALLVLELKILLHELVLQSRCVALCLLETSLQI